MAKILFLILIFGRNAMFTTKFKSQVVIGYYGQVKK